MIELSDVSFHGCRLSTLSDGAPPDIGEHVAFGFVLPGPKVALVKGRVVRRVAARQGGDLGLVIERANVTFYEFLMTLAEGDHDLAAARPTPPGHAVPAA